MFAEFADRLRAAGAEVVIEHWRAHDGTREVGRIRPLPANEATQDWSRPSLYEAAAYYARRRK